MKRLSSPFNAFLILTGIETLKEILGEDDLAAWHKVLQTMVPKGKTSMLQDVEAGRKTEVEIFGARVVELGHQYGVPTPVNEVFTRILRVLEGE